MRRVVALVIAVAGIVGFVAGGIALPVAPALANSQDNSVMVSSADTVESADCHSSVGGNVFNDRYMFDGDKLTINYANNASTVCVANWTTSPDDSRWYYGATYVNVTAGCCGAPHGVEGPNLPVVRGYDRQCEKENSSDPGDWSAIPYGISQVFTTMSSSVTAPGGSNPSMMYAYDLPTCGKQNTGGSQIVYRPIPVEPQITTAFATATAGVNVPVDLTITVSNTQVFRSGAYGTFTGLGFTLELPANASAGTGSTTCRGGSVTGTTSVVLSGASLGGSGYETEGSCTVTVPVTFTAEGAASLTTASLSAGATNRGSIYDNTTWFNQVAADITVTAAAPPTITPGTQTLSAQAGKPVTPTEPFTPSGLTEPITYSVSPDLPEGLILDPDTGVISGTPRNQQDALTYTITASDGSHTATADVTITIAAADPSGGLPDTGTSLRIGLGVLITGLVLWALAWFAFGGRRRLTLAATDLQVRDLLAIVQARLSRLEKRDDKHDKR